MYFQLEISHFQQHLCWVWSVPFSKGGIIFLFSSSYLDSMHPNVLLPNLQPLRTIVLFSRCPLDGHHLLNYCQSQTYYRRVGDFSAAKPSEAQSHTFNLDTISQLFPTGDQLSGSIQPSAGTWSRHYAASCSHSLPSVDPDSSYGTEHDPHAHCHMSTQCRGTVLAAVLG